MSTEGLHVRVLSGSSQAKDYVAGTHFAAVESKLHVRPGTLRVCRLRTLVSLTLLKRGILGYVLKSSTEAELILAVRNASEGRRFLDPTLAGEMLVSSEERQQDAG